MNIIINSIFEKKIKRALNEKLNSEIKISSTSIFNEIKKLNTTYGPLLLPRIYNNELLDSKIWEIELLLTYYTNYYKQLFKSNIKKPIKFWGNDSRPFHGGIFFVLKFLIQDIVALRNLAVMKFENQFNATFRNCIEKIKIYYLLIFDYEFAKNLLFNDIGYDQKEYYYKLTRQKAIEDRIKNILKKVNNKNRLHSRDKSIKQIFEFLQLDTLKIIYNLSSKFIHTNDMIELLNYYNDNNKLDLSLSHNSTKFFLGRLDYAIEFLLCSYLYLNQDFFHKNKKSKSNKLDVFLISYYSIIIQEKYTKKN